jgi:protein TonB
MQADSDDSRLINVIADVGTGRNLYNTNLAPFLLMTGNIAFMGVTFGVCNVMSMRALILGLCISCCFELVLGFLPTSHAQESGGKPEVPTPKTVQSRIGPLGYSANSARNKPDQESQTVVEVSALAAAIAARISSAVCQPKNCAVVVTSFTLSDGNTSAYGVRLADILSHELANKEYKLRVIDRKGLQTFLAKERVPVEPEHRTVIRWISEELNARFIVVGTTEKAYDGVVSASQLIDTEDKKWPAYSAVLKVGPLNSEEDLAPIDPSGPLPVITTSASGERVELSGADGTTVPSCYHMPNPPYSDGALKLKLSGSVTAEAVVNSLGGLENMRIVRGMPGGLNETTLTTMRTWRCHPALKDGKPVAVLVPFNVTFRLY